jgi:hypothetical protein
MKAFSFDATFLPKSKYYLSLACFKKKIFFLFGKAVIA